MVTVAVRGVAGAQEGKERDQVAGTFENHMRTQGRLLTFSHGGIMPAWYFFPLIYSTFEKAMTNKTITMVHDNNEATVQIGVHSATTGGSRAALQVRYRPVPFRSCRPLQSVAAIANRK